MNEHFSIQSASPEIQALFRSALAARENAYVPYSSHQVGAAIRTSKGEIFSGCNVENASFGVTACAERTAIQKAISEVGKIVLTEVLVVTDQNPPWPPCGLCRQVIAEFGNDITLYLSDLAGNCRVVAFSELFPNAFNPSHLG